MSDLFMELEYQHSKNSVVMLQELDGLQTLFAPQNANTTEWAANVTYNKRLTKDWTANFFARGFRWGYEGNFNNAFVAESGYAYTFGITSALKLPARMALDATYNYYSPYGTAGAIIFRRNFARLALKKSFLDDRLIVTTDVSDIFQGQIWRSEQRTGNLVSINSNYVDTRRVTIGAVFNFGKTSVKKVESRELGNEDLINRASN